MMDDDSKYVGDKMFSNIWSNYDGTMGLNYKKFQIFESVDALKEEINDVLNSDPNDNMLPYCVTLYDVVKMSYICFNNFYKMQNKYLKELNDIVKSVYNRDCKIDVGDFRSSDKSLELKFKYISGDYDKIIISKKDEQLYIKKTETNKGEELLYHFDNKLVKLYDEYEKYMQYKNGRKVINCSCMVDINEVGLGITIIFKLNDIYRAKSVFLDCRYNNYICDDLIHDVNCDDLLKRIYIQIKDCPEWMKNDLCM